MDDGHSIDLGIGGLGPAIRIGSGGFADVYRAQQLNLRRDVAVKVLRASASEVQARMRFERECHAVGAVSGHPNIVGVHEGGFTADGRAYLVMEFFSGGSLLERIEREGPMSATETIDVGLKIGRALGVAHDAGVLHRDVKPANILVSSYGEPALADFGIARVEGGEQTATGLVTASFVHASPEVLEGASPSAASDIYSLGSTLFELFTGRAPHFRPDDESVWALMNRVISESVPDPLQVGMPEPLASAVRRSTARMAQDRYQTAPDFVAALDGTRQDSGFAPPVVNPQPVQAPPDPAWQTPAHPSHPSPPQPVDAQQRHTVSMSGTEQQPVSVGAGPVGAQPAHPGFGSSVADARTMAHNQVDGGYPAVAAAEPTRSRGRGPLVAILGLLAVALLGTAGFLVYRQTVEPALAPLTYTFVEGSSGPLDEGMEYELTVLPAAADAQYRLVIDGQPIGEPQASLPAFVADAGRHAVAVEVTRGTQIDVTEAIETYTIGPLPEAGYRANLVSITESPANWSTALANFDSLFDGGHTDLELLPSSRFPALRPGFWNLYVPGFGESIDAARDYCVRFALAIPDECFPSRFDPEA